MDSSVRNLERRRRGGEVGYNRFSPWFRVWIQQPPRNRLSGAEGSPAAPTFWIEVGFQLGLIRGRGWKWVMRDILLASYRFLERSSDSISSDSFRSSFPAGCRNDKVVRFREQNTKSLTETCTSFKFTSRAANSGDWGVAETFILQHGSKFEQSFWPVNNQTHCIAEALPVAVDVAASNAKHIFNQITIQYWYNKNWLQPWWVFNWLQSKLCGSYKWLASLLPTLSLRI